LRIRRWATLTRAERRERRARHERWLKLLPHAGLDLGGHQWHADTAP
jgi:hypothetical protein